MIILGALIGVNFVAVETIIFSKRLRLTVTWSSSYSGGSDAVAGKEGRRDSQSHLMNGAILYSHCSGADCDMRRVYYAGGES